MGVWPSGGRVRRWRPRGDVENRACKTNARHEDTDMRASSLVDHIRGQTRIFPPLPRITGYQRAYAFFSSN